MAREVRITIDDDEVFERMKRRKAELDLSWEEVLHRGLRRGPAGEAPHGPHGPAGPVGPEHGPGPSTGELFEDIGQQIRNQVRAQVVESLGGSWDDHPHHHHHDPHADALGAEVGALESAEDATLTFDFLEDRPDFQVPLRVNLRTSADGLDVEVVAVRRGKDVRHMNRFGSETRKRVTTQLARGEAATLRFADGAESYRVRPALTWSRDESGRPAVAAVDVEEVLLDDER